VWNMWSRKLWEGPSHSPTDLIGQMTMPVQLEAEFPRWHGQGLVVGLSDNVSMVVPILRKEAASSKELLQAIRVSDEVADRVLELGNEIRSKLTGSSMSKLPDEDESSSTEV
jgi:hypothetical protein